MSKMQVFDTTGSKKSDMTLDSAMFGASINEDLMHRSVVRRLHNARNPIAHTKTRAEVAATRKKAFRQKGTGNARRGSMTTNLLRGGGVVHGPRNTKVFNKRMNKGERKIALFSALSARADKTFGLTLDLKEPKTSVVAMALAKMEKDYGKKVLIVVGKENKEVVMKSVRNLPTCRVVSYDFLSPLDILWSESLCFVNDALESATEHFNPSKK